MSAEETALVWARARSAGPLCIPAGSPVPAGMIRLAEPAGTMAWLIPQVPETADARVLAEMGLGGPLLEQPNDTARMLAAVLRCCWEDPLAPVWPGASTGSGPVLAVFRELTGPRDDMAHRRSAVAALRRLDQAGWVLWEEPGDTVRLGPRVALWSSSDLTTLRQLWRSITAPEPGLARPARPPGPAEEAESAEGAEIGVKVETAVEPDPAGEAEPAAEPGPAGEAESSGEPGPAEEPGPQS